MFNTLTTANLYFATRYGAVAGWTALDDGDKTALLTTAYNRINTHSDFDIPSAPTTEQLTLLKMAENELAWYMKIHISDEDRRLGLQAQGVNEAGIVKEKYNDPLSVPFPPVVLDLLNDFTNLKAFYASDLTRDEDESVNA